MRRSGGFWRPSPAVPRRAWTTACMKRDWRRAGRARIWPTARPASIAAVSWRCGPNSGTGIAPCRAVRGGSGVSAWTHATQGNSSHPSSAFACHSSRSSVKPYPITGCFGPGGQHVPAPAYGLLFGTPFVLAVLLMIRLRVVRDTRSSRVSRFLFEHE